MDFKNFIFSFDEYIVYFLFSIAAVFSTTYIFCKSQNIRLKNRLWYLQILFGLLISVVYMFLRFQSNQIAQFILYLGIPILLSIVYSDEKQSLYTLYYGLISLSLYQVFKTISILISGSIFWLFGYTTESIIVYFANMTMTVTLSILFMQIKRFKKGLCFFQANKNLGLGIALSGIILILNCISLKEYKELDMVYVIAIFGSLLSGFGLYLWIRRSITAHYRERLQLKSEEHYQALLSEKEQEIEKLNQSNEYLAKVVHRDNHLMSSLNSSIDAYFASGDSQFRDEMLRDIQTLAKERGELIAKELREAKILPSTGNLLIDGAINDLYTKAAAHGIDFSLTVSAPVGEVIGKFISQTDLQTLICDHIKDAMIAVEATGEGKGKILVEFAMNNGSYSVTVFDGGVAFEPDTLSKLGKERVTTHADNGGSGIGFMTTFETLRKAHASLKITEFETKTPFTKSVSFRFNGENTFTIQSYRSDMLREVLQREDIAIL